MFSVFGLTAGIVYWQAETHLQIITAFCGASIPSLLFLSSILLNRIKRSLEVSEKKNTVSIRPFSSYLVFLFQTQRQKTTREWPIHTVIAVLNIEFIQSYGLLGAKS